ncbi:MAG: hypothetical protein KBF89_05250 [Acidimicrobiia bacterium]|nr:hypothetical protein [Acidimicrobiia bacterium]
MKNNSIKLVIFLLLISMLSVGCSSDKKDDKKRKSSSSQSRRSNDDNYSSDDDSSSSDRSGGDYSPITESEYNDNIDQITIAVKSGCTKFQDTYNAYKTPDQDDDGFTDIMDISGALNFYDDAALDLFDLTWPDDDRFAPNFYSKEVIPFIDGLRNYADELEATVDAAITDSQTAEQAAEVHNTVKDASDYINRSKFGPCNV